MRCQQLDLVARRIHLLPHLRELGLDIGAPALGARRREAGRQDPRRRARVGAHDVCEGGLADDAGAGGTALLLLLLGLKVVLLLLLRLLLRLLLLLLLGGGLLLLLRGLLLGADGVAELVEDGFVADLGGLAFGGVGALCLDNHAQVVEARHVFLLCLVGHVGLRVEELRELGAALGGEGHGG